MKFALIDEETVTFDSTRQLDGDRFAPRYAAREKTGEVEPTVWCETDQTSLIATELLVTVGGSVCDTVTADLLQEAMCNWWGPKLATNILRTCLLTYNHGGYVDGLVFEQRLRDAMGYEIGVGTAQIMKLIIACGKLGRPV